MKSLKTIHIFLVVLVIVFVVFLLKYSRVLYSNIYNSSSKYVTTKEGATNVNDIDDSTGNEVLLETTEEYNFRKPAIYAGVRLNNQKLIDYKLSQLNQLQSEIDNNMEPKQTNSRSAQIKLLQSEIKKLMQ